MQVAKNWKTTKMPSKLEWMQKMYYILLMSKLLAMCKFHAGQFRALILFKAIWQLFITYWYSLYSHDNTQEQFLEII